MKVKKSDKKLDDGEKILKHLDLAKAQRPGRGQKQFLIDNTFNQL